MEVFASDLLLIRLFPAVFVGLTVLADLLDVGAACPNEAVEVPWL